MAEILEALMVILFGVSWPVNIVKSVRSKTAKGKSFLFLILIWIGYIFGVCSKFIAGNITYVAIFYVLNLFMVSIDIVLYINNKIKDKKREETEN